MTERHQAHPRWLSIHDVPFLVLAVVAALTALATIPIWLEQAFSYSAMVGRPELSSGTAATGYACRADFVAWLGGSIFCLSLVSRGVFLRMTTGWAFWVLTGRDLMEHVVVVGACWVFEWIGGHEPLRSAASELANWWCNASK